MPLLWSMGRVFWDSWANAGLVNSKPRVGFWEALWAAQGKDPGRQRDCLSSPGLLGK